MSDEREIFEVGIRVKIALDRKRCVVSLVGGRRLHCGKTKQGLEYQEYRILGLY